MNDPLYTFSKLIQRLNTSLQTYNCILGNLIIIQPRKENLKTPLYKSYIIVCFHYIGSFFTPFRNEPLLMEIALFIIFWDFLMFYQI